jgi:DNA-3-methyladenine glycosylase II
LSTEYVEYLCNADQHLAEIIKNVGSYAIQKRNDSYLSLIEAIIYQQLTGKAASTIYSRLLKYFDGRIPKPYQIFSSPEVNLRAEVGISRTKIAYLKDLAAHIADGRLFVNDLPSMTDGDVITQ